MLSDTSLKPAISSSIRCSMALRLTASRSNSSWLPVSGMRRDEIAGHDGAACVSVIRSMRLSRLRPISRPPPRPDTAMPASVHSNAERTTLAEFAPVLDVAADDQAVAIGQPEDDREGETLLDAVVERCGDR